MGGLIGTVAYEGELGAFMPYLRLGERVLWVKARASGWGSIPHYAVFENGLNRAVRTRRAVSSTPALRRAVKNEKPLTGFRFCEGFLLRSA